jgi:hypothetical protein
MNAVGAFYADIDKLTAAFRGNGALAWADHHPRLFDGTEWLRQFFEQAGYTQFRRAAETPINMILQASP